MCKVSDKLKLCSCKTDIDSLKHYWVFHRFEKDNETIVMGEAIPPAIIDPEIDRYNKAELLRMLNEENVFDMEMNPAENDRLEVSFEIGTGYQDRIFYGFEFRNNKWEEENFDPFEWEWHHKEERSGKIKNALQRKFK